METQTNRQTNRQTDRQKGLGHASKQDQKILLIRRQEAGLAGLAGLVGLAGIQGQNSRTHSQRHVCPA